MQDWGLGTCPPLPASEMVQVSILFHRVSVCLCVCLQPLPQGWVTAVLSDPTVRVPTGSSRRVTGVSHPLLPCPYPLVY